jgi:AraC-like DNA-binding protein
MLVVSTRPAVRERLKAVSAVLNLSAPKFIARIEDALGEDSPLLILDLGSCCKDTELLPMIRIWETYRPGSELVLFTPLIDREAELTVAVSVVRETRFIDTRVMTTSDFYRDEVWRNLRDINARAALEVDLRAELVEAVSKLGTGVRAEALVIRLLHSTVCLPESHSPRRTEIGGARVIMEAERKRIWKRLRASRQLPASWLLAIFRLLWYTKLHERGWPTSRIAQHLGYPSARHFRVMMRRRLGLSIEQLNCVRYADAVRWAAGLLVAEHPKRHRLTMRALVEPLLSGRLADEDDARAIQQHPTGARGAEERSHPLTADGGDDSAPSDGEHNMPGG